ncbi:undecaprenyl/decaprenyl-phosphate alpha-N-acetylglucosaminyl 1-phosphate transferase [Candidatus Sumerlaeota bacterium]|nr:undecaprenyl/decaprenyl-phosphate alpha-N-acetylglucosaminyl 1-phosphate transferase [Candidatus Sumerlaeota bacterium]
MLREILFGPQCISVFWGCMLATIALTPLVIVLARKTGAVEGSGYRKIHCDPKPLMGGLAIGVPFLIICLVGLSHPWLVYGAHRIQPPNLSVLAAGCIGIMLLGAIDDLFCMRARYKLLGQILIALFVCDSGYVIQFVTIPGMNQVELGPLLGVLLTVLWIIGLTNAFNLVDGMDGLAAGIGLIGAVGLAVLAALGNEMMTRPYVSVLCLALAGSLLGFLLYNFYPARIFLGDTGSMFLGFVLSTIALMASYKASTAVILIAPVLALGLPIFETLASIVRRMYRGHPIFTADQRHTHHRLLSQGFTQRQTAIILYSVALMFTIAAVLSRLLESKTRSLWIPLVIYLTATAGIIWLAGYLRPQNLRRTLEQRQRNRLLQAFANYAVLHFNNSPSSESLKEVIGHGLPNLRLVWLEATLEEENSRLLYCERQGAFLAEAAPDDCIGKIQVSSAQGVRLVLRYRYDHKPDAYEAHDINACLASMFSQLQLKRIMRDAHEAEHQPVQ